MPYSRILAKLPREALKNSVVATSPASPKLQRGELGLQEVIEGIIRQVLPIS